ncbi:hypothetical protein L6164_012032 [Bauhinia variegata]|uniref:Uncharacterized protein n=1 Tax=Bauhinia variegata TaxID=167791 RepID=A0ACB9P7X2_BAUVA|nr:hypothetical protein L6164_012032 [Bauhinia variegata]
MQALRVMLTKRLSRPISTCSSTLLSNFYASSSASSSPPLSNSLPSLVSGISTVRSSSWACSISNLLSSPWSAIQYRGIKVAGSDVRVGNIIEKQGRVYEVVKVDHSHEGRGKATIKVELRDIGHGNKVIQRLGTEESIEKVFVEEKSFIYMCMDHDGTVVLMDTDTLDQLELSKDLFGKNAAYLRDELKVKVYFYDDKPLSASVPKRVTCTVKEAIAATPRNKKVVLDNGLIVEVPPHIEAGDAIVVNTMEDTYMERAKA